MACSSALFGVLYFLFRIVPSCITAKKEVKDSQIDDPEKEKLTTNKLTDTE
jgi:hypothetical protein